MSSSPWQRPTKVKYADLTVGSVDELRVRVLDDNKALDRDDSGELHLLDAFKQLEDCWYDVQPTTPNSDHNHAPTQAPQHPVPKPEVVAALKALGSFPARNTEAAPWPGAASPCGSGDEGGDRFWGVPGEPAAVRMPADRQFNRPAQQQRNEWSHLTPHLAVVGRQLVPDSESGLQFVPAPTHFLPSQPAESTSDVNTSATGQWWASDVIDTLVVTGTAMCPYATTTTAVATQPTLQQPISPHAPPPPGGHVQGDPDESAAHVQDECDDEVLYEDGTQEEMYAVQWDAWEEHLLNWGRPPDEHSSGRAQHDNTTTAAAEGKGSAGPQPKGGCGGWSVALGPGDERDRRALDKGLPPIQPHLSMCDQLTMMALTRWWHHHMDDISRLVSTCMVARANARKEAWEQHKQKQLNEEEERLRRQQQEEEDKDNCETDRDPSPQPPEDDFPSNIDEVLDETEHRGPTTFEQHIHQQQQVFDSGATSLNKAGGSSFNWRSWFTGPPVHLPLGQGVLTQQGFQASNIPAPAPITFKRTTALQQQTLALQQQQTQPTQPPQPTRPGIIPGTSDLTDTLLPTPSQLLHQPSWPSPSVVVGGASSSSSQPHINTHNSPLKAPPLPSSLPPPLPMPLGAMWPSAAIRPGQTRRHTHNNMSLRTVSMPAILPRHPPSTTTSASSPSSSAFLQPGLMPARTSRAVLPPDYNLPTPGSQPPTNTSFRRTSPANPDALPRVHLAPLDTLTPLTRTNRSAPNSPTQTDSHTSSHPIFPDLPPIPAIQYIGRPTQPPYTHAAVAPTNPSTVILPPLVTHPVPVTLAPSGPNHPIMYDTQNTLTGAGGQQGGRQGGVGTVRAVHAVQSPRTSGTRAGGGAAALGSVPAGALSALSDALQLGVLGMSSSNTHNSVGSGGGRVTQRRGVGGREGPYKGNSGRF